VRILIVTPEYPPHAGGGILKYYAALAPALARHGCDVTVLVSAPSSPDFPDHLADGVRVVSVKRADCESRANELAQFSAAPEFRRWLAGALAAGEAARRLGEWDAIEAVDFGLTFAPFMLNDHGSPVVVQLHGSLGQIAAREPRRPDRLLDHALTQIAEVALLPRASELQTYGSANAREWSGRLGQRVRVLPPPLSPLPANGSPAGPDALVVARVQSWKGPAVLCEALRLLPGTFPVVRWVGRDTATAPEGGSLASHLSSRYPDVWGRRIVALGQRPFDDVATMMAAARIVIVPSAWDVFNLTAAEAMSAGRVVVCSSAAGASDLIESGRNGFVFHAGDAASLAEALGAARMLPDAARARMGEEARETVVSRLGPDAVAEARLDGYASLGQTAAAPWQAPADWIRDVFAGGGTYRVGPEFLDQMNIRDLSKYLGRRLRNRLADRMSGGA
jgi:glycosyltransferase involved in cell wall biosynthesis